MDPVHIPAWQRFDAEVSTSGKLAERNLRDLARIGVKHVLDLAPKDHAEALEDEQAKLRLLGVGYTHIHVPFDALEEDQYAAFVRAYEALPRPLHVHCIANHRVSAFFYRYHLECGWNEEDARRLMREQWQPDHSDHPLAAPWKDFVSAAKREAEKRRKIGPADFSGREDINAV